MSVATSPWDDLLQGEEIAYLSTEPAREARLAPLPDDLHTRVREALAGLFRIPDGGATVPRTFGTLFATRRTATGAFSVHTSRTCCAACAAWRGSTAPSRSSCSPRRRSRTRASSSSGCSVSRQR